MTEPIVSIHMSHVEDRSASQVEILWHDTSKEALAIALICLNRQIMSWGDKLGLDRVRDLSEQIDEYLRTGEDAPEVTL